MVTKPWSGVDLDYVRVDLENQGHRSKVKVTGSKNVFSALYLGLPYIDKYRGLWHWPPMNKFACKLHGYIVYIFFTDHANMRIRLMCTY